MRYYLLNLYLGRVLIAVVLDLLCFTAAAALTWILIAPPFPLPVYASCAAVGAFLSFAGLYYAGGYSLTILGDARNTLASVFATMGMALAAALVVYFALHTPPRTMDALAHTAGLYFPFLLGGRSAFRFVSAQPRFSQRLVVIGTSDLGVSVADAVRRRPNLGTEMVGFLSDEFVNERSSVAGFPVLGKVHEIEKIVDQERVGRIVVASKSRDEYFPADELLFAKLHGRKVQAGVDFYERVTGRVYVRDLRPSYLIFSHGFRIGPISAALKRALDLVVAGVGLIVFGPLLALCAVVIRLDSRGPVLYRQRRVGQHNRPFDVLKLRTMRDRAEDESGPMFTQHNDDRVTRVGRLLRKMRIDELPQLWNVLRGDMSLVGPRPERPEFLDELNERYPYFKVRSTFKPGITGWAQIRYGYVNEVDGFEEKLALDLFYMKHRSLSMDLLILWETARTVLLLRGL